MRDRRALLILLAALALAGCSRRDRLNPLDLGNPVTGGRPTGFNAVAGYQSVSLWWDPRPGIGVDGFEIWRRVEGDSLWRSLGRLSAEADRFFDSGLSNGVRVGYRLDYVIDGAPANRAVEDEATPGPVRAWVADPGSHEVVRLSPDGRDVTLREDRFGEVGRIAVDPLDGFVWASASLDGVVWGLAPSTGQVFSIQGIRSPDAIALGPLDHTAWICDRQGGVAHYYRNGTAATPGYLNLIDDPVAIAVCGADGSVWVVERGGNRVRHFSAAGVPLGTAFVGQPSRIAVDPVTRIAWVTSYTLGRVWRIGEAGQLVDSTSAALGPIGVALDHGRGRAWIADDVGGRLLGLDLATLAVEVTATGFGAPYDVAVDPSTGQPWVLSRSNRSVARLDLDGSILDYRGGFSDPVEVRIDPGQ